MASDDYGVVALNTTEMVDEVSQEHNGDDLTKPFDFADVTLLVEDKPIYFNRGFLAMHSPHFKRLFYGANAKHDKEMRLQDKKFDDVLALLKLLKLNPNNAEEFITNENVEALLKLAEEYQLGHVMAMCENFLLLNWKFDKSKIVRGLKLAARFGLHKALKSLLVKPGENHPEILSDENVEPFLAIAKEYELANVIDLCEKYLLCNWKQSTDKVVRAVELSAKFGLEKALANLLKTTDGLPSAIADQNVEQLLNLCEEYSLFEVRRDCEAYIIANWTTKPKPAIGKQSSTSRKRKSVSLDARSKETMEEFGLSNALANVVANSLIPPSTITDTNLEQLLSLCKEHRLADLLAGCEAYIMANWITIDNLFLDELFAQKVVRAAELSVKFGLDKAMAKVVASTRATPSSINDTNLEQLLSLCKEHRLCDLLAGCEAYIMANWIEEPKKALRAVEIAHEMKLPSLAKAFIPLAAFRPLEEIDRSIDKLSTELFCAIVHDALVKMSICGYSLQKYSKGYGVVAACSHSKYANVGDDDPVVEKMLCRIQHNV